MTAKKRKVWQQRHFQNNSFDMMQESQFLKEKSESKNEIEIAAALETAKHTLKVPTVIEFIIEPEENIMPIVPPGNALDDMIMDGGDKGI